MDIIIAGVLIVISFIAGVLVGRANPKKADIVAEVATKFKNKVTKKVK